MKKVAPLFSGIIFTVITGLHAQDFYANIGVGYAFAAPGQKLDQYGNVINGTITNISSSQRDFNTKNASFSAGAQTMIGMGLQVSKNIGVELNASLTLAPRKYTEYEYGLTNSSGQAYNFTAFRQAYSTKLILPTLVLQTAGDKCNLYMKMGVALPFNSGIKLNEVFAYQAGDIHEYGFTIHNYFSLGFTASAGVKINISDRVALRAEVSTLYLNLSRREEDLNSAVINGMPYPVSQLTGVTTTHYSKNGMIDQNGDNVALPQPYSNIAINAGISYSLSNPDHHKKKK